VLQPQPLFFAGVGQNHGRTGCLTAAAGLITQFWVLMVAFWKGLYRYFILNAANWVHPVLSLIGAIGCRALTLVCDQRVYSCPVLIISRVPSRAADFGTGTVAAPPKSPGFALMLRVALGVSGWLALTSGRLSPAQRLLRSPCQTATRPINRGKVFNDVAIFSLSLGSPNMVFMGFAARLNAWLAGILDLLCCRRLGLGVGLRPFAPKD